MLCLLFVSRRALPSSTCRSRCGLGFSTIMQILLLIFLEIGLVPARSLETKPNGRDQFLQPRFATTWTYLQWRITQLLQFFHALATGVTTVFINRHLYNSLSSEKSHPYLSGPRHPWIHGVRIDLAIWIWNRRLRWSVMEKILQSRVTLAVI